MSEPARHSMDDRARNRPLTYTRHSREVSGDSFRSDTSYGDSSGVRIPSESDASPSGSQILSRSDVFRSPTMKKFRRSLSRPKRKEEKREGHQYEEPASPNATIRIEPPTRRHTADSRHEDLDSNFSTDSSLQNKSDPSLQDIAKQGNYPLQRASMWAGWIGKRSKKAVGSLIPSQPMGHLEKVFDMWQGGKKHYRQPAGMEPHEDVDHTDDESGGIEEIEERYRNHFALPETEQLSASYFGYLHRVLPIYGKLYLGTRHCCFRSMIPGTKTKVRTP